MELKNEKKSAFQPIQNLNQHSNTIPAAEASDELNSKILIWCLVIGIGIFAFFLWRVPKDYLNVDFYIPDSKLINSIPDILNFKAPSMIILNIEHYAEIVIYAIFFILFFHFFGKRRSGTIISNNFLPARVILKVFVTCILLIGFCEAFQYADGSYYTFVKADKTIYYNRKFLFFNQKTAYLDSNNIYAVGLTSFYKDNGTKIKAEYRLAAVDKSGNVTVLSEAYNRAIYETVNKNAIGIAAAMNCLYGQCPMFGELNVKFENGNIKKVFYMAER